jgi:hypothetical protein
MFALIMIGWLIFRSESLENLLLITSIITFHKSGGHEHLNLFPIFYGFSICLFLHWLFYQPILAKKARTELKKSIPDPGVLNLFIT